MRNITRASGFVCLFFWLASTSLAATTRVVKLNTSALVGHPAGPFSLAFQLTDGSGLGNANNTALISGFQFGGGAPSGNPALVGEASGSLSSSVKLMDSSFVNFFIQPFTPGSELSFVVSLTTNVQSGDVPDQFSFSVLDNSGVEIPTQGGDGFDVLLAIDIESQDPVVQTFPGDGSRAPAAGGSSIPLIQASALTPPTIRCTGCYFLVNDIRATLAFNVATQGSSSTFSYNYRIATQAVQFTSATTAQISVAGKTATFSGLGTLNGQPGYSFAVIAKDGGSVGSGLDTVSVTITGPNSYSYAASGSIVGGDIIVAP